MNLIRRVKRFAIAEPMLLQLFRQGNKIRLDVGAGFPDDGVIIRHYYDRSVHAYFVVVQSATFAEVEEGGLIPFGYITVNQISQDENSGGANVERQEGRSQAVGSDSGLRDSGETGTESEGKR